MDGFLYIGGKWVRLVPTLRNLKRAGKRAKTSMPKIIARMRAGIGEATLEDLVAVITACARPKVSRKDVERMIEINGLTVALNQTTDAINSGGAKLAPPPTGRR